MIEAPFQLALPQPKNLTAYEELALVQRAYEKNKENPKYVLRLARLLAAMHRDDEVIEIIANSTFDSAEEHEAQMLAGRSLLGRNGVSDASEARSIFLRAVDSAPNNVTRAHAHSELGKSLVTMRRFCEARAAFNSALIDDVHTPYGVTRLAALDLLENRERALFEMTESLVDRGVLHSGVLGARYLALAALSRREEAAAFDELASLLWQNTLPIPAGWDSLDSFNDSLTRELLEHSGRRRPRVGSNSGARWRVDDLLLLRSQAVPSLLDTLKKTIEAQVEALAAQGHLWSRARTQSASLQAWGMITSADAFDAWHMHVRSWLSGVYYVRVPNCTGGDEGPAGSIEFGCPEIDGIGRRLAGRRLTVHPQAGQLLLFPSHFYHRTHPTWRDRERISIAFDVSPKRFG